MAALELHLVAPVSAIRKRPRLAKMVPVFLEMGYAVWLHGWERLQGECRDFAWTGSQVHEAPILRGGGYVSRKARAMYPLWMIVVFLHVLKLGRKKIFFCLGWESAFPALLASKLTSSTVVFDDADRFSLLLRLPGPAHRLLVALERWTSRNCLAHLVPEWSRYEWHHSGMKLLRNTPTTLDFQRAQEIAPPRPTADFVVYVNGWLGETRGAPIFLDLMQRLVDHNPRIKMIAAGWTDCDAGRKLFQLPNVRFDGELSTEAALALYHSCDVVLTYYDPDVTINRRAASNKWGDCIFLGKPFIVNFEVETARPLITLGYGYAIPYKDVDGLLALVETLAANSITEAIAPCTRGDDHARLEYQPFDQAIRGIVEQLALTNL